jgi:hypothetical protein
MLFLSFFSNKLFLLISNFFLFFFYFFNWFFYFFICFLFLLNSLLFCGDMTHGRGSYLLIMHSTLAIFTKFFWYLFLFIFFIFFYFFLNIRPYYYFYYICKYLLFISSLFGFCYYFLFLLTGIIWGDYSWGFSLSVEYRFVLLCLYILFFLFYIFCFFLNFDIRIHLSICFGFIFLLILLQSFSLLQSFFFNDYLSSFRVELHQSDESLHFFLLSISGYYISLIFIYVIYLFFILFFYYFICFLNFFFILLFSISVWYFRNVRNVQFFFLLFIYLL